MSMYDLNAKPPSDCKHRWRPVGCDYVTFVWYSDIGFPLGGRHYDIIERCDKCGFYHLTQSPDAQENGIRLVDYWSPWRFLKETDKKEWEKQNAEIQIATKELDDYVTA